ncbi:MAG: FHA domain-containing protein [Myxococcota bacterium]
MKAWLLKEENEHFTSEVIELPEAPARLTVGRAKNADIHFDTARMSRTHCHLVSDGTTWSIEIDPSSSGTFFNGERINRRVLRAGDRISFACGALTFLESPPARHGALEAAIDEAPDDAARIQVWADWLHERGDSLARQLLGEHAPDAFHATPRVQLTWRHGLVHGARLRSDGSSAPVLPLLASLLSRRDARWLRSLYVELTPWLGASPAELQRDAAAALRGLLTGPHLPVLEELSFGAWTEPLPAASLLPALVARLPARFPRLRTPPDALFAPARLELECPPATPGVDFYAPQASDGRLSLERGVWVGSAVEGQLRALAPGVPRSTSIQSFVVREQAPRYCFIPLEEGLTLNGAPAFETRLAAGDVIADRRGLTWRVRRAG